MPEILARRTQLAELHTDLSGMGFQLKDNPSAPDFVRRKPTHQLGDVFPIDAYGGPGSKYADKVLGADVPAWDEGEVGFVVANVYADPTRTFTDVYPWHRAFQRRLLTEGSGIVPVRTSADLRAALALPDVTAVTQSVEGIYGVETEEALMPLVVDELWEDGIRSLHASHNNDSALSTGHPTKENYGLTPLGKRVFGEATRRGFMIDFSHASPATVTDILNLTAGIDGAPPPIVSHTGSRELVGGKSRNIHDDHAVEVARRGGLIGVMPARWVVEPGDREDQATIGSVGATYDYYLDLFSDAGISNPEDHLAVGTDFCGMGTESVIAGNHNIVDLGRNLDRELARRGHNEAIRNKILFGNAVAVFERGLPKA